MEPSRITAREFLSKAVANNGYDLHPDIVPPSVSLKQLWIDIRSNDTLKADVKVNLYFNLLRLSRRQRAIYSFY